MNQYKVTFKDGKTCSVFSSSLSGAKIEAARLKGLETALSGIREVRRVVTWKQLRKQLLRDKNKEIVK